MSLFDKEKIYNNDRNKYGWRKDLVLFSKYYRNTKYNYKPSIEFDRIESLINLIIDWYEMKEPDRKYDLEKGIRNIEFDNIEDISSYLSVEQLRYRLLTPELRTIDCKYRGCGGYSVPIGGYYNDEDVLCDVKGWEDYIAFYIKDYNQMDLSEPLKTMISVNKNTGMIRSIYLTGLDKYINLNKVNEDIDINQLYTLIKDIKGLDIKELERILYYNQMDLSFRDSLFELVVEGLINSNNTTPEYGCKRAKVFIEEFSSYYNQTINISEKRKIKSRL